MDSNKPLKPPTWDKILQHRIGKIIIRKINCTILLITKALIPPRKEYRSVKSRAPKAEKIGGIWKK